MQVKNCAVGLLIVLLLNHGPVTSVAKSIPKEFTQCKINDPKIDDCMQGAIQSALVAMKNGLPSYQLLPIDPLSVTRVKLEQGHNQPISVKIDLSDVKLYGISAFKVNSAKADIKNRHFDILISGDDLKLDADYEMDGKFLVLPLRGKGKTKMSMSGIEGNINFQADTVTGADGDIYWNVSNINIKLTKINNFQVHFDNLFNGDKALGDSTNKALNDNWEGFWAEIGPALEEAFGEIFRSLANVIFSKVQEKNLFAN